MTKKFSLLTVCALGAFALVAPIHSADVSARPKPKPKPASVVAPKKPANFKQIKRALRTVKGQKRTLYRDLKAAHRSENFNQQRKKQFADRYQLANENYKRNRTQANFERADALYKQYTDARQNHVSAANLLNSVKTQVNLWQNSVQLQLVNVRTTATLAPPKPRKVGRPKFSPQALVRNRRVGASVVPNARAMLQKGGPVARRDMAPAVRDPQPIGNPANFPAAALAAQRAQQMSNQLARFQLTQVTQFAQQNPQQAAGANNQGAAGNRYIGADAPFRDYGAPSAARTYSPPPAAISQIQYDANPLGQVAAMQRPVLQNQYNVVQFPGGKPPW